MLAFSNPAVFVGTFVTAVATAIVSIKYQTSEMVPYIVPMYGMMAFWLGSAPPSISTALQRFSALDNTRENTAQKQLAPAAAALLALIAVVSTVVQFPLQNHSNDHLAELFARNAYSGFEPNSIVLTDYWDGFVSPSYYLQQIENVRPDLVLVDTLLLKYPWYLQQLQNRYPWLVANSSDITARFTPEQNKWVNGEPYNASVLNQSYIDLMSSFVERNIDKRPIYTLFTQGNPEDSQIAASYVRQPWGSGTRLWPPGTQSLPVPPMPNFDLRGYLTDKTPVQDDFAQFAASLYQTAYQQTAQVFAQANQNDKAQQLVAQATQLQAALTAR